jgi:hypothetical protein
LPITLKYGVSTVKIWAAYPPSFRLVNYAFKHLKFMYVKYVNYLPYFAPQSLFYTSFIKNQLKNTRRFKVSTKKLLFIYFLIKFFVLNIHFKKKKLLDNRFSNTSIYKYKKFYKIKYNFEIVNPVVLRSFDINSFFKIFLISTRVRLFKAKNLKSFKMFIRKPYTKIISIYRYVVNKINGWSIPSPFVFFIPTIVFFSVKVTVLIILFIWIRGVLPRYRYDQLMYLNWKTFIPLTTMYLVITSIFLFIFL